MSVGCLKILFKTILTPKSHDLKHLSPLTIVKILDKEMPDVRRCTLEIAQTLTQKHSNTQTPF